MAKCRIDRLHVGQRVDLEADPIADPDYAASGDPTASENPEFQFEFEEVASLVREDLDCIAITFASGFVCRFPPEHEVEIDGAPGAGGA